MSNILLSSINYFGNQEILKNFKVGFLCSRKVPADIILKTYDWAIEQRDKGVCIVSGFHSIIERDVFDIIVKGKQPIILVLARGLKNRWESKIMELLDNNRLLIITPFPENIKRITEETAKKRNEVITEISDKIFFPYYSNEGSLSKLVANKMFNDKIITL